MTDASLGQFELLEKLGAGGMGEVYKARDKRLQRTVAIKILPGEAVRDESRKLRFIQEARLASSQNHPNIITIYEIDSVQGPQGDISYIAMEFVSGRTLAHCLERRNPSIEEIIDYAIQIADGLASAHAAGIVHRDLKPANVMLDEQGRVKILDFGLAKLLERSQPEPEAETQTLANPTVPGIILGTAAYMSPEQAEGLRIDARSDIFSLGAILYEMTTGRQAFQGRSAASLLGAILHQEPEPACRLRMDVPDGLQRIIEKALAKNPAERYQHVDDLLVDLKVLKKTLLASSGPLGLHRPVNPREKGLWRRILPWVAFAFMVVLSAAALWYFRSSQSSPAEAGVIRFDVHLPEGDSFQGVGISGSAIDLSPDGSEVVYAARRGKIRHLFRRALAEFEPVMIPDTQGAVAPILSRDLTWITFASGRQVKRVHAQTGGSTVIGTTEASVRLFDVDIAFFGGCWLTEGDLLVSECTRGLRLFSLRSGQKETVTDVLKPSQQIEHQHQFPQMLPGQKWILFTIWNTPIDSSIAVRSWETGQQKVLLRPGSYARYSPSGHIVFAWQGNVFAVPFDLERLEVTGSAVKVIEGVMMQEDRGAAHFSISEQGSLAYVPGPYVRSQQELVWVDLKGNVEDLDFPPPDRNVSLSPDGKRVLVTRLPDSGPNPEIWVYELDRGVARPLTGQDSQSYWALWTPEGDRALFCSSLDRLLSISLYITAADGSRTPEPLSTADRTFQIPYSIGPAGREVAFQQGMETWDIWMLPLEGKPYPLLQAPYAEIHPAISPDGRFLAFASDESGRFEVKIRPLSGKGETVQVSSEGGWEPVWSRDGSKLYYRNLAGSRLMTVSIDASQTIKAGNSRVVVENNLMVGGFPFGRNYDVSPDGKRFLMIRYIPPPAPPKEYRVIVHWSQELKQLFPHK